MVLVKTIYILMIKVNGLFSLFWLQNLLKEIKTCSLCFYQVNEMLKFGRTRKSCGSTCLPACVPMAFSWSPKLPFVFLLLVRNMVHVFYFLNKTGVDLEMCVSRKYPYPPHGWSFSFNSPPHPPGISIPEGLWWTPPPPRIFQFFLTLFSSLNKFLALYASINQASLS